MNGCARIALSVAICWGRGMNETFPVVYLARHGETAWTITGQHTGLTDLPLTKRGETNARKLGACLAGIPLAKVFTSPLKRAMRTCELSGFADVAELDHDLVEWNYGKYEGLRRADVLREHPDWELFRDGCPGGESPQQVAERADRVVARVRQVVGNVLLFSSGHFLRMLATRWIGIAPINGQALMLSTASLSSLSYGDTPSEPAISFWNDTHHVLTSDETEDSKTREHEPLAAGR
jgi:broad specificity phosphatase PhoE